MPGSTAPARPKPAEVALRLALGYAAAICVAVACGNALVEAALPFMQAVVASLEGHGNVPSLVMGMRGADPAILMYARLPHGVSLAGQVISSDGHVSMTRLGIGLLLEAPTIAFGLVLAWPARGMAEMSLRMACAAAIVLVLLVADAPFSLWAMHAHMADPGLDALLWAWEQFLVNGGRLVLGLAAAVIAILIAAKLIAAKRRL
jgi:hypothetical protein